jgi:hypothetical protein
MKDIAKITVLIVGSWALSLCHLNAQEVDSYFKQHNYYDLSASTNGSQHSGALGWNHLHGIGKAKKFSIGYGIRFSSNVGKNADFRTAPSSLTTVGGAGPFVLFKDDVPANFDTIRFSKYSAHSLNASIHLNYAITSKLEVQFNIDALGFTFGSNQTADYTSSKRLSSPNQNTQQSAKPTSLNALLVSDNDIGSLNSEILVKYWFKPQWALKLGATFIFAEYTTDHKLYLDNDRFRNKALMGMVGLSYAPFRTN